MSVATKQQVYKVTVAASCPVLMLACDQGGVFNTYSDLVFLNNYAERTGLSHAEIREIVLDCPQKVDYEHGRITCEQFFGFVSAEIHKRTDEQVVLPLVENKQLFNSPLKVKNEMVELLGHLNGFFQIWVASNTNAEHLDEQERQGAFHWNGQALYEHMVLSHILGEMKPAPDFFSKGVIKPSRLPAHTILLIDDLQKNCDAAASLGMLTHQFTTMENLIEDLGDRFGISIERATV